MVRKIEQRRSNWYKTIIFNPIFLFILGFIFVVIFPAWLRWFELLFRTNLTNVQINTLIANTAAFSLSFLFLHKAKRLPGTKSLPFIIPIILLSWFTVFTILLFIRQINYARIVLIYSFICANLWWFAGYFLNQRFGKLKLALIPYGEALKLKKLRPKEFVLLETTDIEEISFDGVVVDLKSPDITNEWQRFIAACTLSHMPVYNTQQIIEFITGRVQINHLSENIFGSLLPSTIYMVIKRLLDVIVVLIFSPVLILIMLITAIAIKIESPGDIFFNQKRMGYKGKEFTMFKFRSMRNDLSGAGFTSGNNDPRITKVGKIIRKFRIDELPQMINVLKGEMSLIGPRPESMKLVEWYEKEVPFFSYRHVVRPGISGWAQVNQGYAAEIDGMIKKLQYDLYYIKNISLWLDVLIFFKTLRTILTGFGSR